MDLATRELGGSGRTIVFLHGLFGSSQNWASAARRHAAAGRVVALDLRNHGDSPHARPHSLAACVGDLREWCDRRVTGPVILVGHSMGGLVAMAYALARPAQVAGVAAIDIAPRAYHAPHGRELAALRTDISGCATRADIDALLAPIVPDAAVRGFLMTNAVRGANGFRWRIDAGILAEATVSADFPDDDGTFGGEAMLVACGRSSYVTGEDRALMRRRFPAARVEELPGADHWPNVSAPAELDAVLADFVERCNKAGPGASVRA